MSRRTIHVPKLSISHLLLVTFLICVVLAVRIHHRYLQAQIDYLTRSHANRELELLNEKSENIRLRLNQNAHVRHLDVVMSRLTKDLAHEEIRQLNQSIAWEVYRLNETDWDSELHLELLDIEEAIEVCKRKQRGKSAMNR